MSVKIKYLLVFTALISSLLIYHFYRVEDTLLNVLWSEFLGKSDSQNLFRLPDWVVFNLPETLWVFSATILSFDFAGMRPKLKPLLISLPLVVATSIELMQFLHISDGVFDLMDLLAGVMGFFFAISLSYKSSQARIPSYLSYSLYISSYCILILADVV